MKITEKVPTPAACLEPLAHCRNVASLIFLGISVEEFHLKLLNWFYFFVFIGYSLF